MNVGLYSNIMGMAFAIIFAGIIIVFITTGSSGENSLNALRIGYVAVVISLLLITGILLNEQMFKNKPLFTSIKLLFPFLFIAITVFILLSILGSNFQRIADSKTSNYYLSFSRIFALILIIQLIILFSSIFTQEFINNNILSGKSFSMLMLLGVINSIVVIILSIILKYYVTDG